MSKKIFSIILVTFSFSVFTSRVIAQYFDNNFIEDVPLFIAKREANKILREKDAEVLRTNKVHEVHIKTDEGKFIAKFLVNRFGFLEDFLSFNLPDEKVESRWRFGYDVSNNLTSISRVEGRLRMGYILTYENNRLASIQSDSAGFESQYDFAYTPEGNILKMTSLNLVRDTIGQKFFFTYDSENRLIHITDESQQVFYYEVDYKENSTVLSAPGSYKDTYKFKDNRITEETYNFYSKIPFNIKKSPDSFKVTEYYAYSDNGLIQRVKLKTSKTSPKIENYEYVFDN